jgi:hypothetical protein
MDLYLDLETIPTNRPDVIEFITANIKPPATFKKAESIAAWMKDEGPSAAEEAVRKTSLDGTFGKICVIGWALGDEAPQYLASDHSEDVLLREFHSILQRDLRRADDFQVRVVGHNVAAFDLRFFVQRSMVNGIRPHLAIARAARAKPWESDVVFDTMVQWAGQGNRVKLDTLCKAFGIESPKGELDGSKVWDWVKAGRINEVGDYCLKDVKATREVFKRMIYAS